MKFEELIIYLLIVNLIAVIINCADKIKAKHHKWRVPEATLWFVALIGGATATYITMKTIRHKTKHKKFMIGMPLLMVIQIALLSYFLLSKTGTIV